MSDTHNNENAIDALNWTAACYLLGELSASEAAEFEARLEHDQTAREALAAAVAIEAGLSQSITEETPPLLTLTASTWNSPSLAQFALAASILVLLAVGGSLYLGRDVAVDQPGALATATDPNDAGILISRMLEFEGADFPLNEEEPPAIAAADVEGEAPDWLLSAVSHEWMDKQLSKSLEN